LPDGRNIFFDCQLDYLYDFPVFLYLLASFPSENTLVTCNWIFSH